MNLSLILPNSNPRLASDKPAVAVAGKAFRKFLDSQGEGTVNGVVAITTAKEKGVQQATNDFETTWKDLREMYTDGEVANEATLSRLSGIYETCKTTLSFVHSNLLPVVVWQVLLRKCHLVTRTLPWEIAKGQRAPQIVEVSLTFAPIHDLPLGLDYKGRMMAASHPAGLAHTTPYDSLLAEAADDESQMPANVEAQIAQAAPMDSYEDQEGAKQDPADKTLSMPPSMGGMGMGGYAAIGAAIAAGIGAATELLD